MEPFRVNLTGQANWGTKHSAVLGRHADLVGPSYIEVEMPGDGNDLVYSSDMRAGFNLVEYVELDIGGQVIDRQYGEFLAIWSSLTLSATHQINLTNMNSVKNDRNDPCSSTGRPERKNLTYIPLSFWFCRNPGAALPLIALQYHEVKINILWNKASLIFTGATNATTTAGPAQANLLVDYIYLDVEERRRMAQESHEYLIEQTQFNEDKGLTSAQNRVDLTFNHPVKELIWVTQNAGRKDCRINGGSMLSPLDYDPIIYDCTLQLNGQDRMQALPGKYFNTVQPFQHHTGTGVPLFISQSSTGVYMYSFAIKPEEHQPSGTCNFSRIDTATLVFSVDGAYVINNVDENNYDIRVYAINYNILRVMSGMGGLAYSN
jgi:hypothetical protein